MPITSGDFPALYGRRCTADAVCHKANVHVQILERIPVVRDLF
jgi:hypothetical protein